MNIYNPEDDPQCLHYLHWNDSMFSVYGPLLEWVNLYETILEY